MRFRILGATFLIAVTTCVATGEVLVTDSTEKETLAVIKSVPASFGKPLPEDGVHGRAVMAVPKDGCKALQPPPDLDPDDPVFFTTESRGHPLPFSLHPLAYGDTDPKKLSWIAMISRYGGCTFEDKVRNAQLANYSAVIVYNLNSDKIIPMGGDDSTLIPSVFIGSSDADLISKLFTYEKNPSVRIILTDDEPFDINSYLLPFAIVVGICFLIMLGIVIFKCIQDHRRNRRHRLPKSALKKLPIHKFKNGDPFETCCICLDDFEEGEKLRVLPCDHGYHSKCIDPWLLKNKRICPQCRKKVFASNERGAGLISGSGGSDSDDEPANERAPLLRQQRPRPSGAYGGTSSSASNVVLSTAVLSSDTPSTSRGASADGGTASRLPGRRRRPFFARVADRNRRSAQPFDNTADTSSNSASGSSTSSSDDETNDAEIGISSHHHAGDVAVTHEAAVRDVCEIQRHVASAEVHVPPPVQEEEKQDSEDGGGGGSPLEVVVVVQRHPSSENSTSQNHSGANVETV